MDIFQTHWFLKKIYLTHFLWHTVPFEQGEQQKKTAKYLSDSLLNIQLAHSEISIKTAWPALIWA